MTLLRLFLRPLLIAAVIAVLVRTLLIQVFAIPSGSMMPTLQPGDQVLVTPYDRPWAHQEPRRGEVVVFRRVDGKPGFFIKRIVGVPGDHLEIRDGGVLIDGHRYREPYVLSETPIADTAPEIVPADAYFLMGDHRDDSIDSRVWGFVPGDAMVGRARLVFWSSTGDSATPSADALVANRHDPVRRERIRWGRILTVVR